MIKQIVPQIAAWKMRLDRGKSILYSLRDLVLMATLLKVYNLPYWTYPIVMIFTVLAYAMAGYIDEIRVKLWQAENKRSSEVINPWSIEVTKRLKNIEAQLRPRHRTRCKT